MAYPEKTEISDRSRIYNYYGQLWGFCSCCCCFPASSPTTPPLLGVAGLARGGREEVQNSFLFPHAYYFDPKSASFLLLLGKKMYSGISRERLPLSCFPGLGTCEGEVPVYGRFKLQCLYALKPSQNVLQLVSAFGVNRVDIRNCFFSLGSK